MFIAQIIRLTGVLSKPQNLDRACNENLNLSDQNTISSTFCNFIKNSMIYHNLETISLEAKVSLMWKAGLPIWSMESNSRV